MPRLLGFKNFIDYLVEKHPELVNQDIAAEHDVIYLPLPEDGFEELRVKAQEFGVIIGTEYDSISVIV